MITIESTLDGSATVIRDNIQMKAAENAVYGEALTITATGLTKTAVTAIPDGIYLGKEDTCNGKRDKYAVLAGVENLLIDITGDATTVVAGTSTYCLTADGLCLDAATATGGHVRVTSVDTTKKKARVQFV